MEKSKVRVHGSKGGGACWLVGWMFTIGYVRLSFWQGVLAMVIWPWYLGRALSALLTASGG